jgi:hypothetical protein
VVALSMSTATTLTVSLGDWFSTGAVIHVHVERDELVLPRPRDGRWHQHDMAWHAFEWPESLLSSDGVSPVVAHEMRHGREGLGVRNWKRL